MTTDPFAFGGGAPWHQGAQGGAPPVSNAGWQQFPAASGAQDVFNTAPTSGPPPGQFPQQYMQHPPQAAFAGAMPQQGTPSMGSFGHAGGFPGDPSGFPAGFPGGPDMLSQVASNPMAQVASMYAQQAVQQGMSRYLPGASLAWQSLRYYFDVSNQYVLNKLLKVVFPFRSPRWHRVSVSESGHPNRHGPSDAHGGAGVYAAPLHDDNAPDLYIPGMAFITFVLVHGLVRGTLRAFHPEVLVTTSSTGLVTAILEVALLRAGLYTLAVERTALLDLVAYAGYKYVGLVVNTLAYLCLGGMAYNLSLLYTGLAAAYFTINTLMTVVLPVEFGGPGGSQGLTGPLPPSRAATSNKKILAVGAGLLQLLLMWWLGPNMTDGRVAALPRL